MSWRFLSPSSTITHRNLELVILLLVSEMTAASWCFCIAVKKIQLEF